MKTVPEALRLAERLRPELTTVLRIDAEHAGDELCRLYYVNMNLLAALKEVASGTYDTWTEGYRAQQIARAAIANATGGTE